MPVPSKKNSPNGNRRFTPKPKPLTPQEAVPTLIYGPSNNWIEFSKKMALAAGDRFGRLVDIIDHGTYYIPPLPVPDMTIVDPTMRDKVVEADYRERSKVVMKQETDKSMLYAFIASKLSLESENELKRHAQYTNFNSTKDPLELWKALQQLHLTNTVSKNAAFVLQQTESDYMSCNQGEFESITKFKERFDLKLKAYNASLDPTNQVSDQRAAMAFLTKLHRTPYGLFYANEINLINADPTKVPANVNEVYVKAKAYVIIATTNKQNGTPVSFATTTENILRTNKKKTPRGNKTNNPNNGLLCSNDPTGPKITPHVQDKVDPNDPTNVPTSNATTNHTRKDLSIVQCYNRQAFGHYARSCPAKNEDALSERDDHGWGLLLPTKVVWGGPGQYVPK